MTRQEKSDGQAVPTTRSSTFLPDFLSSVVLVLVAIPLCIGISVACGVPPERGLITGIIGGLVVGSFAGSPLLASGPAASLIVPVFGVVQDRGLAALAPMVMLAGLFQLIAGRLRLGQWFRAVAPAVIHGMLTGIGVLIIMSQLHVAIDGDPSKGFLTNLTTFPETLFSRFQGGPGPGVSPVLVGAGTVILLVAWNRFKPRALRLIPGHLIALLVVTAAVAAIGPQVRFLELSSNFFEGLDPISVDRLRDLLDPSVIAMGLMFAFIASAATLLTAVAIDQRQTHARTDYNREMMAQGVGNILTGSLGGLPMTGVIVRSSVNVDAGARTRLSTMMHGLWILLFVVAIPHVLELVPRAALGAILVYTGLRLINVDILRTLYERGRAELAICLLTIFGVVFIELFVGILLGLGAAVAKLVYTFAHLEVRHEKSDDRHHLHLTGSATFLRLPALAETLERVPEDKPLQLHIDNLEHIDHACLELFSNWEQLRQAQGHGPLLVNWSHLGSRYHRKFLGLYTGGSRGGDSAVLSLMWSEWERVYGPDQPRRDLLLPGDWIEPSRVHLSLEAERLEDVLEAAAASLAATVGKPAAEISAALGARAMEGQVAVGEGVSIPHAAIVDLDRPLAALVRTTEPLDLAGETTDLFFVLLAPDADPRLHLLSLAHVGRLCHDPKVLGALRSTEDPDEVVRILRQADELFEARAPSAATVRLLAVLELGTDRQVARAVELLDEGLARPVVLSMRDGAAFEMLRKVLHLPPSRRLAVLPIEDRDQTVLAGLVAEFARQWPSDRRIRLHIMRGEIVLPPPSDLAARPASASG